MSAPAAPDRLPRAKQTRPGRTVPKRGRWIGGRWYPRWRLEELSEKYRDPPDGDLDDDASERRA
jgi:hypothetical protein